MTTYIIVIHTFFRLFAQPPTYTYLLLMHRSFLFLLFISTCRIFTPPSPTLYFQIVHMLELSSPILSISLSCLDTFFSSRLFFVQPCFFLSSCLFLLPISVSLSIPSCRLSKISFYPLFLGRESRSDLALIFYALAGHGVSCQASRPILLGERGSDAPPTGVELLHLTLKFEASGQCR